MYFLTVKVVKINIELYAFQPEGGNDNLLSLSDVVFQV